MDGSPQLNATRELPLDDPAAAPDFSGSAGPVTGDDTTGTPYRPGMADLVLAIGLLCAVAPTLLFVARETWSTDAGAHGVIVMMTGLWLVWHKWPIVRQFAKAPPIWHAILPLLITMVAFVLARVTHIVEVEGYVMYGLVIVAAYALVGWQVIRRMAFPIVYLAFTFPPPETVIYAITLPMKVTISELAVWLLGLVGYPIGGTGVTIQIGQYQLLVAAACSGLNSIVSLSALSIFYVYVRYANNMRLAVPLILCVLPIALAANFIRVLILILLTYHFGEATAQGLMHDLAGVSTFVIALGLMFLTDMVLRRILGFSEHHDRGAVA